jgi:hypothetical protein
MRELFHGEVSSNRIVRTSYTAIGCIHCDNDNAIWHDNLIYDLNVDDPIENYNTYGISMTRHNSGWSRNTIIENNTVINAATWECFDAHSGSALQWLNNLCVYYGATTNAAYNNGTIAPDESDNIVVLGNVMDAGIKTSIGSSIWTLCGNVSCNMNDGLSGTNRVENNTQLFDQSAVTTFVVGASPMVSTVNNTANIAPQTVSGVTLASGNPSATFVANRPNGEVAVLRVQMSGNYWQFPTGLPGTLEVGGTNSGGFHICDDSPHAVRTATVCQASGGTPPGTYNDFTVIVTLHGMKGSPATIPAGSLTLTAQ